MKKCKYCQSEINEKAKVCPHCQRELTKITGINTDNVLTLFVALVIIGTIGYFVINI